MKLLKRSLVLLGCALAVAAAFTACELELGNNDDRSASQGLQVVSLDVSGAKKTFAKDAEFKLGNVRATYVDKTTKVLSEEDVKVMGFDSSKVGTVNVTVSYTSGGKTITSDPYTVTILEELKVPETVYYAALDGSDEGVFIIGNGSFAYDDEMDTKVFKNVVEEGDSEGRCLNFLLLPRTVFGNIKDSAESEFTVGFYVKRPEKATNSYWSPLFSAQAEFSAPDKATYPFIALEARGTFAGNWNGSWWLEGREDGSYSTDWLTPDVWHYVTLSVSPKKVLISIDGKSQNDWEVDGETGANSTTKILAGLSNLKLFALGGAQVAGWGDPDVAYCFSQFSVWDEALTLEQIEEVILSK